MKKYLVLLLFLTLILTNNILKSKEDTTYKMLLDSGNIYMDSSDFKEALIKYNAAIKLRPDIYYGYYSRAILKHNMSLYLDAICDIDKAIKLKNDEAELYYLKGEIYDYWNEKERYNNNSKALIDEAIKNYKKAVSVNPNNSEYHKKLGIVLKTKSLEYEEASKEFTKAILIDSSDIELFILRSDVYYNMAELGNNKKYYELAVSDFNKVIEKTPDSDEILYKRGHLKYLFGDYFGAINDFTKILSIKQNDDIVYLIRSEAKLKLGDYDGALNDCNQSIKYNSKYNESFRLRGQILMIKGDYDNALDSYDNAVSCYKDGINKYNKKLFIERADAYLKAGKYLVYAYLYLEIIDDKFYYIFIILVIAIIIFVNYFRRKANTNLTTN